LRVIVDGGCGGHAILLKLLKQDHGLQGFPPADAGWIMEAGLEGSRLKSIALRELAAVETATEPARTLLGTAVAEGFRRDMTACLHLHAVVADGTGGAQCFFDIAAFEDLSCTVGVVRPDAREAVGLQLKAHRQLLVFGFGDTLACG